MWESQKHYCVTQKTAVFEIFIMSAATEGARGHNPRYSGEESRPYPQRGGGAGIASHWITLSAWKRSVGGMVSPSSLAVLRLMTSSNFIGCSTGRSAGLAPFKILST